MINAVTLEKVCENFSYVCVSGISSQTSGESINREDESRVILAGATETTNPQQGSRRHISTNYQATTRAQNEAAGATGTFLFNFV